MLRMTLPLERRVIPTGARSCRVAIVGGGFSGASLARQLALGAPWNDRQIIVFEPRAGLGAGLAYDTSDPALRLNVEASRMRAIPGEPEAFARWLEAHGWKDHDPDARVGNGSIYARRSDFARFMAERMQPFLDRGTVQHVRERVEEIERSDAGWCLTGSLGTEIVADIVVIATSHPGPKAPGMIALALNGHPRFITDPSRTEALSSIRPGERVLLLGAGLTAFDIIASLRDRGHDGEILAFSRSGLLPQPQVTGTLAPTGNFVLPAVSSARELLRRVRLAIAEAERSGLPWQSVFDALRQQGQTIWQVLPHAEQARLLRHLRRRFETHRYRMPPQVADLIRQDLREGRLLTRAGRICRVERGPHAISVDLIVKPDGIIERRLFEWVVVATGPDHKAAIGSQPCLVELERQGYVKADDHGLGIACDTESRAIGSDGHVTDGLFVAGPLARGTFGELTGVPEIAAQSERIAAQIIKGADGCRPIVHRS
ncbi:FAD/NAD(P)-binding protein [Ciceribacter ferrooxidans]|uniref:Hydroxyacylglutathione hydrolase n=1 Tax=Ciceribacter ferrooxidans TaxID=2509717 RepID=A0A4Q2SZ59_9HYPH|nr:FAD/NAD(P)-binding protein [Ciceribacter ferrooxidans]RYC10973.1 hydroxyacylglutathione hydrolase [Ciceribacter ferrooxidans]